MNGPAQFPQQHRPDAKSEKSPAELKREQQMTAIRNLVLLERAELAASAERGAQRTAVYEPFLQSLQEVARSAEGARTILEEWVKAIDQFIGKEMKKDPEKYKDPANYMAAQAAGIKAFVASQPLLLPQTMERLRQQTQEPAAPGAGFTMRVIPDATFVMTKLYQGLVLSKAF